MKNRTATVAAVALGGLFLACILLANYVTTQYGMVPVGFGITATAGTYFAGLTFVLRDSIQDAVRARLTHETPRRGYAAGIVEVEEPSDWRTARPIFGLIAAGAFLSYLLAVTLFRANGSFLPAGVTPISIAVASGLAFAASETADLLVYTPLRRRGYARAAVASNVVGATVDTALFLWVSGFPVLGSLAGQMAGKLIVTLAVVPVVALLASRRRRRAYAAS